MNNLKRLIGLSGLAIAMLGLSATASAVSVGFNGATADLTIESMTGNGDGSTTYRVVYTFDFAGWDPAACVDDGSGSCGAANATNLGAINFGFGGPESPASILISTTAGGTWSVSSVVANANGCSGGGDNSVCAQVDPLHSVWVNSGASYEWVFDVTYDSFVPNDEDASIRAWFVECRELEEIVCRNAGLMSLRTSPSTSVPEPGTLGMLGVGLMLLGMTRRRKFGRVAA